MREKEAWKKYSSEKKQQVMEFAETYRRFISDCKTERECVDEIKKQALQAGFEDMQEVIASGKKLQPGDRVFADNKGKKHGVVYYRQTAYGAGIKYPWCAYRFSETGSETESIV